MTKYQPYGNFLMLRPDRVDEKTPGGIIIPETSDFGKKLNEGTIMKMGHLVDTSAFNVGDRVVFGQSSEYRVKIDAEIVIVLDAVNVYLVCPAASLKKTEPADPAEPVEPIGPQEAIADRPRLERLAENDEK